MVPAGVVGRADGLHRAACKDDLADRVAAADFPAALPDRPGQTLHEPSRVEAEVVLDVQAAARRCRELRRARAQLLRRQPHRCDPAPAMLRRQLVQLGFVVRCEGGPERSLVAQLAALAADPFDLCDEGGVAPQAVQGEVDEPRLGQVGRGRGSQQARRHRAGAGAGPRSLDDQHLPLPFQEFERGRQSDHAAAGDDDLGLRREPVRRHADAVL